MVRKEQLAEGLNMHLLQQVGVVALCKQFVFVMMVMLMFLIMVVMAMLMFLIMVMMVVFMFLILVVMAMLIMEEQLAASSTGWFAGELGW